ncbi:MAG: copper resistance protein CopC [Thaumarchaeota archaeon]|nr:copper resistance protein CopC [Nitrososphaerota archaeon]MBI3642053.1 copper resistance protein CopC [Nitrososphaerota archaeon]
MYKFRKTSFQIILVVIIILSIVFVIPNIPNSYAHAFVTKSDPVPSQSLATQPSKVDVYFNDPIDIRYSQLKVLDSNGNEVQEKDQHYINNDESTLSVSLPSGLKDGVHTVTTKVLDQTDGHVTKNAYVFAIGQAIPQNFANPITSNSYQEVSISEAIVRFPALVGQVLVVGSSFATLWLWGPISRISWLGNALAGTRTKIDRNMIKLAVIGSVILLSSGFAMIAVQAYSINAGILDAISTKFGSIWIIRMIASAALFALSFTLYHKIKKSNTIPSKSHVLGLLGIDLIILVTTSLIGHGAATGKILPLILDFIHNVVASLWIGGIFYIAFIVMPNLKQLVNENVSIPAISILIPRFSTITITILGAIVITGPFLLYSLENNLALTLASTYGKILIVKLSLAAAMISIGAYNQMIIHKQAFNTTTILVSKSKTTEKIDESKTILSKFSKATKIESIIGIALIASVAVLVDSGVPSSEFQNQLPLIQEQNIFALATPDNTISENGLTETKFVENGSRIVLTINPFSTGNNDFKISFLDYTKNLIDIKSVQLRLTQVDKGIGPITIVAQQVSTGVFSANTAFGFAGHWNARVEGVQNKENSLNLVASFDDLLVKPKLDSLAVNIREFKTPGNNSLPFYPVYDNSRNVVWVSDSTINSDRIFEFDLNTTKFIEHKIDGINIVSAIALDSGNNVWYTDPISKSLGNYNPNDYSNNIYKIPTQGIISGITIDNSNNIWLIDSASNGVLKFDPSVKKFTSINLGNDSQPLGIMIDKSTGQVWVAEGIGKIASIDPNNYKIDEYAPREQNVTLATPTGIISDPETGNIYISEHDGYAVSVFNPLLKTFKKYTLDSHGLPLGMVFDNYHNLWVAQHTLDKIAVVDPRTGQFREFNVPSPNSFVQWITADSQGDIIMAEQRANALGIVTTSVNPTLTQENSQVNQANNLSPSIPRLGFSYVDIVAPSIAGFLMVIAFFYSKSVMDLKKSLRQVKQNPTQ